MELNESIMMLREDATNNFAWNCFISKFQKQIDYQTCYKAKTLNTTSDDLKQEISIFLLDRIIPRRALRNRGNDNIRKEIDVNKSNKEIYNCLSYEINNFLNRKIIKNVTRKDLKINFKYNDGRFYKDRNNKRIVVYLKFDKNLKQHYFIDNHKKIYLNLNLNKKEENIKNKDVISSSTSLESLKYKYDDKETALDIFYFKNHLYEEFDIDLIQLIFRDDKQSLDIINYLIAHDNKENKIFVRSKEVAEIIKNKIKPILREIYDFKKLRRKKQKSKKGCYNLEQC